MDREQTIARISMRFGNYYYEVAVNFERYEIIVGSDCTTRFLSRVDTRGWGWIYRDFKADYATLLNYHARRAPFNEAASIISRTSVGHTSVDYPDPFLHLRARVYLRHSLPGALKII